MEMEPAKLRDPFSRWLGNWERLPFERLDLDGEFDELRLAVSSRLWIAEHPLLKALHGQSMVSLRFDAFHLRQG